MSENQSNALNEAGDAARSLSDAGLDAGDRAVMALIDATAARERAELPAGFGERLFGASIEAYRGATPMRLVHGAGRNRVGTGAAAGSGGGLGVGGGSRRLLTPLRLAAAVALFATIGAAMLAGGGAGGGSVGRGDGAEFAAGWGESVPYSGSGVGGDEIAPELAADPSGVVGLLALALSPDDGVGAEIDRLRVDSMLLTSVVLDDSFVGSTPESDDGRELNDGAAGSSM